MAGEFVDANVLLRHLLQDHADHSARATAFIARLERREVLGETSSAVVAEVVYVLERTYKQPKAQIRRGVQELMKLRGLNVWDAEVVQQALEVYVEANISYTDAFNAVLMRRRGISTAVSLNHDFDRVPWLTRVEP